MHDATLPEQIHGLEVAAGCGTVRPGEIVELRFRLRNRRAEPTPPARLTFLVPPGWAPLGPAEGDVPPLAVGDEHLAVLCVRAESTDEQCTAFQAVLTAGTQRYGSNVVTVEVRGRPRFAPPTSSLRILPGDDLDTFVVAADLCNDGDATARDARVVLSPPAGFTVDGPSERSVGDLAAGTTFACSFVLRPGAPPYADLVVADGRVEYVGGACALASSEPFALEPRIELAAESVRAASRLDVLLRVANTGWNAAFDVPCSVHVPAGWRVARGTLLVGHAPVALRAQDDGFGVVFPVVAAQSTVELTFVACATRANASGTLEFTCAEGCASVGIDAPARRALRLVPRAACANVIAGDELPVTIVAWNVGETDELAVLTGGVEAPPVALRSGTAARATLRVPIRSDCAEGFLPIAIDALAADGTPLGAARFKVRVRPRTTPEPPPTATLPEPALRARAVAVARAAAGARLDVQLRIEVLRPIATLRVRARPIAAAPYVAGTTTVDGHALVDGAAGAELFDAGLVLHALPAGTTPAVGWAVLPACGGAYEHVVELCADGDLCFAEAAVTAVDEAPAFATRPDGLAFFVDASTVANAARFADAPSFQNRTPFEPESGALDPEPAPPAPLRLGLRLDATRRALILRLLHGVRSGGIVSHFPILAALFPDDVDRDDVLLRAALGVTGDAVRAIYERLFVKLRIPNYDVTPYDLEDASLRDALLTLLEQGAAAAADAAPTRAELSLRVEPAALDAARTRLLAAPLGGAAAVATLASLLPRAGDGVLAAALGGYVALLADELDAARPLPADAFASYLALHRVDALDEARHRAILALAAPDGLAAVR